MTGRRRIRRERGGPRSGGTPPRSAGTVPRPAGTTLRSLARPEAVEVHTDDAGRPLALREPGQAGARTGGRPDSRPSERPAGRTHRVIQHRESWRIDDEWWRRPISRLYWEVVLENGRIVTLYRDLITERWYLQQGHG